MFKYLRLLAASCLAFAAINAGPTVAVAGDMKAELLASNCVVCHGVKGKSAGHIPILSDIPPRLIEKSIRLFRSDEKSGTIMNRIAKGYTDDQIKVIAKILGLAQ